MVKIGEVFSLCVYEYAGYLGTRVGETAPALNLEVKAKLGTKVLKMQTLQLKLHME